MLGQLDLDLDRAALRHHTAMGAVINMTRALAAEWGPRSIRVNALAPGIFPATGVAIMAASLFRAIEL